MPLKMTPLESAVLKHLLAGDDPVLAAIREQLDSAIILSREETGVSFILNFHLPPNTRRLDELFQVKSRFAIPDVGAEFESYDDEASFVLWIIDGVLNQLEGFTYYLDWPEQIEGFKVKYHLGKRNLVELSRHWVAE